MNFECPNCPHVTFISKLSIALYMSIFRKVTESGKSVLFLCDDCGNEVLKNYRDTYGIGV